MTVNDTDLALALIEASPTRKLAKQFTLEELTRLLKKAGVSWIISQLHLLAENARSEKVRIDALDRLYHLNLLGAIQDPKVHKLLKGHIPSAPSVHDPFQPRLVKETA